MKVAGGLCEIQCCCHSDKAPKVVYIKTLETHGRIISGRTGAIIDRGRHYFAGRNTVCPI